MSRTPRWIVTEYRPEKRWGLRLGLAAAWIGSLLLLAAWLQRTLVPGHAQLQVSFREVRAELANKQLEVDELKQRLALAERAEQVARQANLLLSRQVKDRQDEVASLRSDLSFFQRLVEGGSEQRGLAVHRFAVTAAPTAGVYRYVLTLTQNLALGQVTRGQVQLALSGVRAGQRRRLKLAELSEPGAPAALPYEFKYFQQLEGSLMLPEGFTPDAVEIVVENREGEKRSERVIAWERALAGDAASAGAGPG